MLTINIETSGAAYSEDGDTVSYEGRYALRADLNKIAEDIVNGISQGNILDINGNRVGKWCLK